MIPKTKSIREQMDKLEFIKINNYCSSKDTVKKKKRKKKISHEEGEIMSGTYLIKDLNPEYMKSSYNSVIKSQFNFLNRQKT